MLNNNAEKALEFFMNKTYFTHLVTGNQLGLVSCDC